MEELNRSRDTEPLLQRIRDFIVPLPGVEERLSHGEPTWFHTGKRSFAMFANRHHNDRVALWLAAPPMVQEALIASDGERFFRPPYVGVRGWVGVYLDIEEVDWKELDDLLQSAYETTRR